MLIHQVLGNLAFPLVAIAQKLFLIVQELLVRLSCVFIVGTLDNGIDGASFLAETAIDALGHVNIVPSGSTGSVFAFRNLNGNGLRRASRFAQLAGNATFFPRRITSKSMLTAESRRKRSLLEGVIDRGRRAQEDFTGQPPRTSNLREEENFGRVVKNLTPWCLEDILLLFERFQIVKFGFGAKGSVMHQITSITQSTSRNGRGTA
mmetsp:Transcript_5996/g.12035  ORF Transcript_5996/g.12035 Transcript_5996/m.12035 type:complete len:206 (+) Transcript_5996:69-686(+)